ncbi:hypothetical protein ACEPAG_6890 [Sanghuangporus baumii]
MNGSPDAKPNGNSSLLQKRLVQTPVLFEGRIEVEATLGREEEEFRDSDELKAEEQNARSSQSETNLRVEESILSFERVQGPPSVTDPPDAS